MSHPITLTVDILISIVIVSFIVGVLIGVAGTYIAAALSAWSELYGRLRRDRGE